jgi:nitrile hydratase accessory protein
VTPAPLPGQPRDGDGPAFAEAWEAKAFALTLALHERAVFTWPEWAAALSAEIKAAQAAGDPDLGTTYYRHWLKALEKLVAAKRIASTAAVDSMTEAWQDAARHTPHGQPIVPPLGT